MIVFDLDDTLYLERDFARSGFRHVGALVEREHGQAGFAEACWSVFEKGQRRHVFDIACEAIGLTVGPAEIARFVSAYRNHRPEIRLCPDAVRFLAKSQGPYGLITDGPERTQHNKIDALGLSKWIAHICTTGSWPEGYAKPHPRAFIEMEHLAQDSDRMVYVADNPAKDFVTPNARGWLTIQIRRAGAVHSPVPPDGRHAAALNIRSMGELSRVAALEDVAR